MTDEEKPPHYAVRLTRWLIIFLTLIDKINHYTLDQLRRFIDAFGAGDKVA